MQDTLQRLLEQMGALTAEVRHLTQGQDAAANHGERIRALETEVANLRADQRSAATERRWVIGLLVGALLAVAGLWMQHH